MVSHVIIINTDRAQFETYIYCQKEMIESFGIKKLIKPIIDAVFKYSTANKYKRTQEVSDSKINEGHAHAVYNEEISFDDFVNLRFLMF